MKTTLLPFLLSQILVYMFSSRMELHEQVVLMSVLGLLSLSLTAHNFSAKFRLQAPVKRFNSSVS